MQQNKWLYNIYDKKASFGQWINATNNLDGLKFAKSQMIHTLNR